MASEWKPFSLVSHLLSHLKSQEKLPFPPIILPLVAINALNADDSSYGDQYKCRAHLLLKDAWLAYTTLSFVSSAHRRLNQLSYLEVASCA